MQHLPSSNPSTSPPTHQFRHISIHPSAISPTSYSQPQSPIKPTIRLSTQPVNHPFICNSVYSSICSGVYFQLCVCLFVHHQSIALSISHTTPPTSTSFYICMTDIFIDMEVALSRNGKGDGYLVNKLLQI